jgi:hypothetical protein
MSILNINGGGGGSYIRYMPSANAWVFQNNEIVLDTLVFDHTAIKTGWGRMAEGQAPEWLWDERLGVGGSQPSPDHKRGFSIKLYTKATGTVEWSSTGTGPVIGFDAIFETIWNGRAENSGKVALCKYTGSEAMKVGKGNTRKPLFSLVKWVDYGAVPWANNAADVLAEPPPKAAPKPAPAAIDDDLSFT